MPVVCVHSDFKGAWSYKAYSSCNFDH